GSRRRRSRSGGGRGSPRGARGEAARPARPAGRSCRLGVACVRSGSAARGARRRGGRGRLLPPPPARARPTRAPRWDRARSAGRVTDDELARRLVDQALLEGDFVLRSGRRSSFYLDKYRFETEPSLLRALGRRIADAAAEHEPDADRLAGPAL